MYQVLDSNSFISMYLFEVPTILANSFSAVCTNFDESFDVSYKS